MPFLHGNGIRANAGVARSWGCSGGSGFLGSGATNTPHNWRNWIMQDKATAALSTTARGTGYMPGSAHMPAVKSGEMGFTSVITTGSGDVTGANLAGGLAADADLTGSGTITNAALALIVSAVASLSGSGTVSSASLLAIGTMISSLSGSGAISLADLLAKGIMGAALTGDGDMAGTLRADGALAADITVEGGTLTTANVAESVWGAIAESGLSYEDVIRILLAVAAGKTTIDIGPPVMVAFRDQADTKDRVLAEMSGSERVDVTLNPSD